MSLRELEHFYQTYSELGTVRRLLVPTCIPFLAPPLTSELNDLFAQMSVEDWAAVDRQEIEQTLFFPGSGDEVYRGNEGFKFLVVTVGIKPGIYTRWTDAAPQVNGYSGAVYKKVRGWTNAIEHLRAALDKQKNAPNSPRAAASPLSLPPTPQNTQPNARPSDHAHHAGTLSAPSASTPGHSVSTPRSPRSREVRMMYILEALGSPTRPRVYGNERAAEEATQRALDEEGGFESLEATDSVKEAVRRVRGRR
ncbi:hypothetical protein K435DRAFT_851881 [Dendrothele bispora CBS 962.96]|uniref:Ribonuclease H1 N-terminal domain-containing protein n=1 Tax=Dendrothele bispora (strain CBS 962.96) TaxID=1314807 RepID=A0A4V6T5M5_DENBC|nr:hypothetical protein K435DRAFT_851881 [Dendrothele bispora CBS 962.96]